MRIVPLLLISVALVMAGCASKDDPATTTTSTTPTTTTTTTSTTPTSTTTTTTPTTPTSPTKPAPMELTFSADYTTSVPPGTAPAAKPLEIPAGYTMGNLTVTFSCASAAPACAATGVTVKVAGFTCTLTDGPMTAAVKCPKEGAVTPGETKVEYSGDGLVAVAGTLGLS